MTTNDNKDFAGTVAAALRAGVVSDVELAERVGVSRETVRRWASGQVVPDAAVQPHITRLLGGSK